MAKRNQHVIPLGLGWAVIGEGSKKFTLISETQRDAITVAKEIAKNNNSEFIIHGRDGRIREKGSFGSAAARVKARAKRRQAKRNEEVRSDL